MLFFQTSVVACGGGRSNLSALIMSGGPEQSILRLVLFNIITVDVGSGIACSLSKFAKSQVLWCSKRGGRKECHLEGLIC